MGYESVGVYRRGQVPRHRNSLIANRCRRTVAMKSLVWGALFLIAGVAVFMAPGTTGPRIGMGTFLVVMGVVVMLSGNAAWFLRRSTTPSDYEGACPVGKRCPCGNFVWKPKSSCKTCGEPVTW